MRLRPALALLLLAATTAMAQPVVQSAPEPVPTPAPDPLPIDPDYLPPDETEELGDIIITLPQVTDQPTDSFPAPAPEDEGRVRPRKPPPPMDPGKRTELAKLARIMGSLHALRVLCAGSDDQLWRERMATMLDLETRQQPLERENLVAAFNTAFNAEEARRVTCPSNATELEAGFAKEGRRLALGLARWGEKPAQVAQKAATKSVRP